MKSRTTWWTLLLVLGFLLGAGWLLALMFSAGNAYPAYSSLRNDPLGSRVLYESLRQLPGKQVRRNFEDPAQARLDSKSLHLYLGARATAWTAMPPEQATHLVEALREGGTVVLAFSPGEYNDNLNATIREILDSLGGSILFSEQFGISWKGVEDEAADKPTTPVTLNPEAGIAYRHFPRDWVVHSRVRLVPENEAWVTIYRDEKGQAVVAERTVDRGRLILLADAYALSNEGLAYERQTALLSHLFGQADSILFHEYHLGLVNNPGVGTLIRRYGLFPFLGGLILCGLLFVWRTTQPLVPPVEDRGSLATGDGAVAGRTPSEGFLSLLQRGISRRDLLKTCWSTWKQSVLQNPALKRRYQEASQEVESLLESEKAQQDPVTTLQTLNEKFKTYKEPL